MCVLVLAFLARACGVATAGHSQRAAYRIPQYAATRLTPDIWSCNPASMSEMSVRFSPTYWRARADEARMLADEMKDAHARQVMLRISNDYLWLADHATTNSPRESS